MTKTAEVKNQTEAKEELYKLFGEVYYYTLFDFNSFLDYQAKNKDIELLISSPGGSVFDGLTISSLIQRHQGQTTATGAGLVASIASVILLSADKVRLNKDAFLMIHNAWSYDAGNAEELRKTADILDKISLQIAEIYTNQIEKNGKLIDGDREKTLKAVKKMMKAETWLNAAEALELGFIDEIEEEEQEIKPMTDDEKKQLLNKYGASAPKAFLNSINIMSIENNKPAEEQNAGFWDKLKSYFKSNPEKLNEVKNELETEQAEEQAYELETAAELLRSAGFTVLTEEENNEQEQENEAVKNNALDLAEKFDKLTKEHETILNKLKEFETEFNTPSAKNELKASEEQKPLTKREEILKELSNGIKDTRLYNFLNK
jgi:ATP-dependent protease ClpP protease subunit